MGKFRSKPVLRVLSSHSQSLSSICGGALVILFIFWITSHHNSSHSNNDDVTSYVPEDARLMIPQILNHMTWTEGENVLDYGSGNGAVGYHFIFPHVKKHNGHQYSVEYLRANYLKAEKSFPDERISYAQGNLLDNTSAQNFPFKGVTFDKIFAIYVFHMVHNLNDLLSRFREILKEGGVVGFTTLTANNFVFQVATRLSQKETWREYLKDFHNTFHPTWSLVAKEEYGEEKLTKYFSEAGFNVKFLKVGRKKFDVPSPDKYLTGLFWLSPIYEKVPLSMVSDLTKDMRKEFTEILGVPETAENLKMENEYLMGVLEKK